MRDEPGTGMLGEAPERLELDGGRCSRLSIVTE